MYGNCSYHVFLNFQTVIICILVSSDCGLSCFIKSCNAWLGHIPLQANLTPRPTHKHCWLSRLLATLLHLQQPSVLAKRLAGKSINDTTHFILHTHTHTHTHLFNCPLSGVRRDKEGKINLNFTEARDSEWQ